MKRALLVLIVLAFAGCGKTLTLYQSDASWDPAANPCITKGVWIGIRPPCDIGIATDLPLIK